jgi:hypothetical protein
LRAGPGDGPLFPFPSGSRFEYFPVTVAGGIPPREDALSLEDDRQAILQPEQLGYDTIRYKLLESSPLEPDPRKPH